jgi:hypothetical protein
MIILTVVLAILLVGAILLMVFKKDLFTSIFGNSITKMVEKQKRVLGEIEVLKKQQKVESEEVCKDFADQKTSLCDAIDANIQALQAQISSLKEQKKTKCALLDEKKKVTLDKVINDFDQKITSKRNQAKRIGHLIGAERLNMEDILTEELNGDKTASNQDEVRKIGFTSTDTKKTSKK